MIILMWGLNIIGILVFSFIWDLFFCGLKVFVIMVEIVRYVKKNLWGL